MTARHHQSAYLRATQLGARGTLWPLGGNLRAVSALLRPPRYNLQIIVRMASSKGEPSPRQKAGQGE